jgi:glucose-1-phosphate thymidylyltransferase
MKGLLLAGGKGTRLLPATKVVNKHMVPILNTPMIVYPLETLRQLGVTDLMVVSGGNHIGGIAEFLEDGSEYGVSITYKVQKEAGGIAQALGLAKDFVGKDGVVVVLGDNIFDNTQLTEIIQNGDFQTDRAYVFLKEVKDPQRFGVPVFDNGKITKIEEKPSDPKSSFAVTGLYYYPSEVFDIIPTLKPSRRGELEITSVNNWFIDNNKLKHIELQGFWSDAGTPESLKEVTDWAYERRIKN